MIDLLILALHLQSTCMAMEELPATLVVEPCTPEEDCAERWVPHRSTLPFCTLLPLKGR